MPQIWLTYDELAGLMDCDATRARDAANSIPLDRRRSRDGQTRVKLNLLLTEAFVDRLMRQRIDREMEMCSSDLWAMHDRMASRAWPPVASAVRAVAAG